MDVKTRIKIVDKSVAGSSKLHIGEMRLTSEIMTLAEYTEVKSHRAKQIEMGGQIFIDGKRGNLDPIALAELEIEQRNCPLAVIRMIGEDEGDLWQVNDMEVPSVCDKNEYLLPK